MTILDEIINELNNYVLSGKFGVDEIYGDLIRRLFHESDDVKDYIFYELDSKAKDKYNLHKETPMETYLWNLTERIWTLGLKFENDEIVRIYDDFDIDGENKTIIFSVLTLTACSEPDVNYYDDGSDSVKEFINALKNVIQINNITYVEDWDVDECGTPTQSGYITIKIRGDE